MKLAVLCLVCCAAVLPAQIPSLTPDPAGDAKKGGPDLIGIEAAASNGVLTLRARFASPNFDAKTTRAAWVLDTDKDSATGSPGLFGAPGVRVSAVYAPVDAAQIGADAVAVTTGLCNAGSLVSYDRQIDNWSLAESLPTFPLPDGFDAFAVLDSLGKTDAGIRFKTVAYRFSGECPPRSVSYEVQDVAPDVGKPAAQAREAQVDLAAPELLSPENGAAFNIYPRKTRLRWSPVPGATAYLVQVQYEDATSGNGWRPLVLRRVADAAADLDFIGAQTGRWRVWALDPANLAGRPSAWRTFRYSR